MAVISRPHFADGAGAQSVLRSLFYIVVAIAAIAVAIPAAIATAG